jgi:NADPH:quinone reductase-like Zn-dependent oxidoreductase
MRRQFHGGEFNGSLHSSTGWDIAAEHADAWRVHKSVKGLGKSNRYSNLHNAWLRVTESAMRATVIEKFGGPGSLVYTELPEPEQEPGDIVIQIKAFGLNHAEMHMRRGECVDLPVPQPRDRQGPDVAHPRRGLLLGVYLTFFGSFVFGTPGFPPSDVPLQSIANDVATGRYKAKPFRVFKFEEIREAHRVMEANQVKGKMVVVVDGH